MTIRNLTIVGSNMIDLNHHFKSISPKGETVYGLDFHQGFGGKGSNQANYGFFIRSKRLYSYRYWDDTYGKTG